MLSIRPTVLITTISVYSQSAHDKNIFNETIVLLSALDLFFFYSIDVL